MFANAYISGLGYLWSIKRLTIPRYSDFRLFDHVSGFVCLFGRLYTCFGRFGHFACFGPFVSVVSFRCFGF